MVNMQLLSWQVIDVWHKRKKIKNLTIFVQQVGLEKKIYMIC